MEGQLIDHDAEADRAGMPCQGGQVYVGGTEITDGGGLMFDGEVILIPQLLRFLGSADMLVVDIRRPQEMLPSLPA